ncbi:1-acyl-sn-glycerol-3-phosphate acyltransferase [bacterium]|nr:1-acyl-sn-glycerol-3-phosphate acyltransferase [bacterium]
MKIFNFLATVSAWSVFVFFVLLFDPILRISSLFGQKSIEKVMQIFCHCLSWSIWAGFCKLKIEGKENIPNRGGLIIVGNHQSLVESFLPFDLLYKLRPKYVAKQVLGRWIPSISFVLRNGGHCLIDRKDHERALNSITQLGKKIDSEGISTIIFPEGTRSLQGDLQNFKTGGLNALLEEAPQAPILIMLIHNGTKIFPKGLPRVEAGSTVTVKFLPLIERDNFNSNQEIIEHIHKTMSEEYKTIQNNS